MSQAIQRSMAHGAAWMVLFKLVERSLGAISTVILVRLLAPGDFGIVAMATSFIAMAELLSAFGFDVALIQNQNAPEEHYHTAWTLNVLMGLTIMVVMLAMASPIARFYKEPGLFYVVLVLAMGPAISGFENVGVVTFRKELNFRREFRYQLIRKLAGVTVVIPLAFALHSYWALIAGTLAGKFASTVVSYRVHPFRPRFSLTEASILFRFSKWMMMNNFIGFVRMRASDFVIGRMLGPASLGLYNVSAEFATLPTTELGAPINRAILPGFAKIGREKSALTSAYENSIGLLAALVVPAAAGIFSTADFIVPVVLGPKWAGAAPLLRLLAVTGATSVIEGAISTMLLAINFPREITRIAAAYAMVLFALMILFARPYGAVGVAYASVSSSLLVAPLYLYSFRKHTGIGFSAFARATARPFFASVAMAVTLWGMLPSNVEGMPAPTVARWLVTGVSVGVASYVAVLALLWAVAGFPDGVERSVLTRVRNAWDLRLRKAGWRDE